MRFSLPSAELFVPDGTPEAAALARTTHMAVGAHQDDLEIFAFHGIQACYGSGDQWFLGVVATDGAGSPRLGRYAAFTDAEMRAIRVEEQKRAAGIGQYGACALLGHPSATVKDPAARGPVKDLAALVKAARPEILYTHNLADRHDTHVAVALRLISALRTLPLEHRPRKLYGCEVWRDLDWMADRDRVALDVSAHESLQAELLTVFDSQVSGGKRYDLATLGRRRANATYHSSHECDGSTGLTFAMDLTPLLLDDGLSPRDFVQAFVERFRQDVAERLGPAGA